MMHFSVTSILSNELTLQMMRIRSFVRSVKKNNPLSLSIFIVFYKLLPNADSSLQVLSTQNDLNEVPFTSARETVSK